jgi:tetratricopeptide (TPR) repeat protein
MFRSTLALALALIPPALLAQTTPAQPGAQATALAAEAPQAAPTADDKAAAFEQAMVAYRQRADLARHREAFDSLYKLAGKFQDDYDLQVWCARTAGFYAHRLPEDDQAGAASRGVQCADRGRKLNPRGYDARYWWVRDKVKQGTASGIRAALKAVKPMKEFLEKLIADEPQRFEGYYCLGLLYLNLPSFISWGDDEKGMEYLLKAHAMAPTDAEVMLDLAEGYLKTGDKAKALETFANVEKSVPAKGLEWENEDARAWAKKRIKEIND